VLPSGQKLTLGLLATITLEVFQFRAYAPFPALMPFLSASWKSCSVMKVFSTACDMPRSTEFCQNGGLSRLSVYRKSEKQRIRVGGGRQSCVVFGKKFPGEKEV
jgi:hypothetical protein